MHSNSRFLLLFSFFLAASSFQTGANGPDRLLLKELYSRMQFDMPTADNALQMADALRETAYKGGTLDNNEVEQVVMNLHELDCWTLVESCVAIAKIPAQQNQQLEAVFKQNLQKTRYRNGIVDGYGSRIHYFSEWLLQAVELGLVEDMTESLNGVPYKKPVAFMSNHSKLYPKMVGENTIAAVKKGEKRIQAHNFFYIPKHKFKNIEKDIKDGDIIAITSSKSDLDVAHEGFACWQDGKLHLLHASLDVGRVVLSDKPLAEYLMGNSGQTGIMVGRLK